MGVMENALIVWEVEVVTDGETVGSFLFMQEVTARMRAIRIVRDALMDDEAEVEFTPYGPNVWVRGLGSDFEMWLRRREVQP